MTEEEFLELTFEDIKETEYSEGKPILYFFINDFRFFIKVSQKKDRSFTIDLPRHVEYFGTCPLCCKNEKMPFGDVCRELRPYRKQVFEKLINEPKLRLLWLYREYTF